MGRKHKGDRLLLQTRPHPYVVARVEERRRRLHISSLSQYIADVLALHVGRPQLAMELGRTDELPLVDPPAPPSREPAGGCAARPVVQTRPYRAVWNDIHRLKSESGATSVSQYVADILAIHVGCPDLVTEVGRKHELPLGEGLPLAM